MSDANILTIKITDDPSNSSPSSGGGSGFKPTLPDGPPIARLSPEDRQLQQQMRQTYRVIAGLANQRESEERKELAQREQMRLEALEEYKRGQRVIQSLNRQRERELAEREKERLDSIAEYKRGQKVLESLRKQREQEEKKERDAIEAERKQREQQARDASQANIEMYQNIQSAMALSQSGFKSATSIVGAYQHLRASGLLDGQVPKFGGDPQVPKQKANPAEIVSRIPSANASKAAVGEAAGTEAAGAAAAGGEAAAMAGGPLMLIAMAVDKAADDMAASFDRAREGVEMMGDTARKVANDDVFGVFDSNVDRAAKAVEQIPIVGKIYAAEMQLAAAPFREVKATLDTFLERGKQLSQYSGPAAAAYAQADVMRLQDDIREAQQMGAQYAELATKQAEADRAIRDALLPIKMQIAELAITVMPVVVDVLKSIAILLAKSGQIAENEVRGIPFIGAAIDEMKKQREAQKAAQGQAQQDVFQEWLKDVKNLPLNEPANAQDVGQFNREIAGPLR